MDESMMVEVAATFYVLRPLLVKYMSAPYFGKKAAASRRLPV